MTDHLLYPLSKLRWATPTGTACLIAIGTGVAFGIANASLADLGLIAESEGPKGITDLLPIWAQFLATVVIGPVAEEALFRGWLPIKLREIMPGKLAVITSAAVFCLPHVTAPFAARLLMFLGSLVFAALARRYDNLIVPTVAHNIVNLCAWLS